MKLKDFFCFECLSKRLTDRPIIHCLILLTISLFEVGAIINGFISFDFSRSISFGYITNYFMLLISSLFGVVGALVTRKNTAKYAKAYLIYAYCYSIIFFIFGCAVSFFDYYDKQNTFVVFMTMTTVLPAICLIDPASYFLMSVGGVLALLFSSKTAHPVDMSLVANTFIYLFYANIIELVIYSNQFANFNSQKELEVMAKMDKLTGLLNRRSLDEYMHSIFEESQERYFIFSDLDKFKNVNDQRGHYYGDQVLAKTGNLLIQYFGTNCYRYGGDEFIIILDESEGKDISRRVRDINVSLKSFFTDDTLRLSFGCYKTNPTTEKRYEDILIHADETLYEAKKSGRSLVFYEEISSKKQ